MSAMVNLEIPWLNIMSKMDLVTSNTEDKGSGRNGLRKRRDIARYVAPFLHVNDQCSVAREHKA